MTEQLSDIGKRLGALRDVMGISAAKMSADLKIGDDEYIAYERGEKDFSFSFLYNAAGLLGVDIVDIISGESPKLTTCAVVRKGEGYAIARQESYDYKHLAFMFSNKNAEPFMVTAQPESSSSELVPHSHEGQEFNYMISGRMTFHHDGRVYELREGDSVYFDASVPHGIKVNGAEPAKFIAVVIK